MIDRHNLRATYSAEVTAAIGDYIEQGGLFSFISDGGSPLPLEIHFTLADGDLYQGILGRRSRDYGELTEARAR